jgi:hypothetical protein
MPLLEDIGVNVDRFTADTLDGILPPLDLRPEILDDDGWEHKERLKRFRLLGKEFWKVL